MNSKSKTTRLESKIRQAAILAYNPNHGEGGRFASAPGGDSGMSIGQRVGSGLGGAIGYITERAIRGPVDAIKRIDHAVSTGAANLRDVLRGKHDRIEKINEGEHAGHLIISDTKQKKAIRLDHAGRVHPHPYSEARHRQMELIFPKSGKASSGAATDAIDRLRPRGPNPLPASTKSWANHRPEIGPVIPKRHPLHSSACNSAIQFITDAAINGPPILGEAAIGNSALHFASGDVTIVAADPARKGPRAFSMLAYNGGKIKVAAYQIPVVVDLAGMEFAPKIVANLDHDKTKRVGHVTEHVNDGKTLKLGGFCSAATPSRDEVLNSADDGFPWPLSIEAQPLEAMTRIEAGKSVTVNGQTLAGPFLLAHKTKLYGVAFLSHGADENTSVTIAASAADSTTKEKPMDEFDKWIEAMGMDPKELTDKQRASAKIKYDEILAAHKDDDEGDEGARGEGRVPKFDLAEINAAHSEHWTNIECSLAEHEDTVPKAKFAPIKAAAVKDARKLKQTAIKERWSAHRFELEAIKAANAIELLLVRAEMPAGPGIHAGHNPDVDSQVIEAAMCQSLKTPGHEKQFDEKVLDNAHKAFRGRIGLQQVMIMAAAANGMQVGVGQRITISNIRTFLKFAFPAHGQPIEAAASTLSIPGILSNVANKELLPGYVGVDEQWREIAQVKPVSNFLAHTSYRLNSDMEYEELGADGKIKHGAANEESYARQVKLYAKMFALTMQMIVNDDLGALTDMRTRVGAGSKKKFNKVFWQAFLSNSSFFTAGRGNYITGATTTLLTDNVGLNLGVIAFDALRFPTVNGVVGDRVGGMPSILLTPPELAVAAEVIYKNNNLGAGTSNANANNNFNKYRPVKVAQLSDSNFSSYSATAWYLLREELKAICVSFLDGQESPTVDTAAADFDELGIQLRGWHAFGVDLAEYLCGVKSKGAA